METIKSKIDECSQVLHDQRPSKEKVDFVEGFSDLEFDVFLTAQFNLSVPNCFDSYAPYYLKDFCIFECPIVLTRYVRRVVACGTYRIL